MRGKVEANTVIRGSLLVEFGRTRTLNRFSVYEPVGEGGKPARRVAAESPQRSHASFVDVNVFI